MPSPRVVWRFSDGNPGHDNQTLGLLGALNEQLPVECFDIDVNACRNVFINTLLGRFPEGRRLPSPVLMLGAGHHTHVPMLAARRARGGRIILLMKPSLPSGWFDLCVVPRHDGARSSGKIFATEGVLNRIRPGGEHDPACGLILLGGYARHYKWDSADVLEQISRLIEQRPCKQWLVATSRRTPADLEQRLSDYSRVQIHSFGAGEPEWLPVQLSRAGEVWVSEDSVSMLYEALTSGARVGVLKVRRTGNGRVANGFDRLVERGIIPPSGSGLLSPDNRSPFDEAARCSTWIKQQWLD